MIRRKRRYGARKRSLSAPAAITLSRRPNKRKQWSDEEMVAAVRAVKSGMGVKRAAEQHGVPLTTLRDRISGRVTHGTKPGPKPYLTQEEEKELGSFLKSCAEVGYGKTRGDVMHIVQRVATDRGVLKGNKLSSGWWRRFLERQPYLSLRRGDSTAHVRMDAVNEDTLKHYFSLLNDIMTEFDLHSKPSQIYNVDESGIPFDPRAPNIVTMKGTKKVRYRQSGRKGQVTIVGCASASGHAIPPMVIFDAKRLNPAWTEGEFPGTKYGLSDSGWITSDLFEAWLCEHFIQHAVSARPLLLVLDGHSTHYQPQLLRVAKEFDIIILCLPPHTTHEAQPLDCGVFGPLKSHWANVCHSYLQQNPGRVITRFQFSALFSQAWSLAVTPANITAGFRTCGVYPFNPAAISIPANPDKGKEDEPCSSVALSSSCSQDELHSGDSGASSPLPVDFTPEQEQRFQRRFEEGFDVFTDSEYIQWLRINHPESLDNVSLGDAFSSVPVAMELQMESLPSSQSTCHSPPTAAPTTSKLSLFPPTAAPTTSKVSLSPPTAAPTTSKLSRSPPTAAPTTSKLSLSPPTAAPTTSKVSLSPPTAAPTTSKVSLSPPTAAPTTSKLSRSPPTAAPTTSKLSLSPPTAAPTTSKVSLSPPTAAPTTSKLSLSPPTAAPTTSKVSLSPPTAAPTTSKVSRSPPTAAPTTSKVSLSPPTAAPTTSKVSLSPPTAAPTTCKLISSPANPSPTPPSSLSKYLTIPSQITPKHQKALPMARLLTSAEALAQLEQKERKKKEALEEKERKKAERMEKKRRREDEQKRKREEQQKKAEIKAKNAAQKKLKVSQKSDSTSSEACASAPPKKRACKQRETENEINTDMCCVCCVLYSEDINGSGSDWIECACGRWLHEDCAEGCIVGADGRERFCPFCL